MVRIEVEPLDQKDLLEILDYALENYIKEQKNGKRKDAKWYELRIGQLKKLINGRNVQDSIYKSSLGTLEGDIWVD